MERRRTRRAGKARNDPWHEQSTALSLYVDRLKMTPSPAPPKRKTSTGNFRTPFHWVGSDAIYSQFLVGNLYVSMYCSLQDTCRLIGFGNSSIFVRSASWRVNIRGLGP